MILYVASGYGGTEIPVITLLADDSSPMDIAPVKPVEITWTGISAATGYKIYRDNVLIDTIGVLTTYIDSYSLGLTTPVTVLPATIEWKVVAITSGGDVESVPRTGKFVGVIDGTPRSELSAADGCSAHWGPGYNGVISGWGAICYRYIGGNYNNAQANTTLSFVDNADN